MTRKSKLIFLILSGVLMTIVVLVWENGISEKTVRITASSNHKYKVEITERQFFVEHAAYLNAYRDGGRFVNRKLLFTGDFLDERFQEIYSEYTWLSENVLRISESGVAEQTCEIIVANESASTVSYLLLETMYSKAIIFDLAEGATVQFKFPFVERLSGQGEMAATRKRFGAGVEEADKNNPAAPSQINIKLTKETLTINATDRQLRPSYCCAPDRPDFYHESQY
jgi:hypothetical protein